MNGYVKKVSHTLLLGLAILAVAVLVYLVYPKYQVVSNSGSIYRLNKITGRVTNLYPRRIINSEELYKSLGIE